MHRVDQIDLEIRTLRLASVREEHNCACVALNRDLGIGTMMQQEEQGRVGLGCGFVSECLSAYRNCLVCKGTGIKR